MTRRQNFPRLDFILRWKLESILKLSPDTWRTSLQWQRRKRQVYTDDKTKLQLEWTTGGLLHDVPAVVQGVQKRKSKMKNRTMCFKKQFHLKVPMHWNLKFKNIKFCSWFYANYPDTSQFKTQVWFYSTGLGGRPTHKKRHPFHQIKSLVSPFEPTTVILFFNDSNQSSDKPMLVIMGIYQVKMGMNWIAIEPVSNFNMAYITINMQPERQSWKNTY